MNDFEFRRLKTTAFTTHRLADGSDNDASTCVLIPAHRLRRAILSRPECVTYQWFSSHSSSPSRIDSPCLTVKRRSVSSDSFPKPPVSFFMALRFWRSSVLL